MQNNDSESASFEKTSKYFFWIAGAVTALAALPIMLSPVAGFRLAVGIEYFDKSPQMFPDVAHWGCMVVAIGVLMFVAASRKELRRSTILFATFEKAYIVGLVAYCFLIDAPYARSYLLPALADGTMALGGIWYLLRSKRLQMV